LYIQPKSSKNAHKFKERLQFDLRIAYRIDLTKTYAFKNFQYNCAKAFLVILELI